MKQASGNILKPFRLKSKQLENPKMRLLREVKSFAREAVEMFWGTTFILVFICGIAETETKTANKNEKLSVQLIQS